MGPGGDDVRQNVVYRAEFFREGDCYVGLVPELEVSSFGETLDEAKQSLQEAVEAFVGECETLGTLQQVMEESGFAEKGGSWLPRQPVATELLTTK